MTMRNISASHHSRTARMCKKLSSRTLPGVAAISVLATVAACSSGGTSSSSGASSAAGASAKSAAEAGATHGNMTVGFVTINETASFFTQMIKGAQAEAKKLGVNLVVNNPDNSVSKQNTAVEDYANQNIKAIIVDSINGPSVDAAVKYAKSHGSHVVAVDGLVNSPSIDTQIGVSNQAAGAKLGKYYCTWAKKNLPGGKGKIGVIGALNSAIQIQRQNGFVDTVKKCGGDIIQVVDGKNVESTAQTAAQNLVVAQPNMTVVYDTGEPANIGAISALKAAGKAGKVPLFGWDLDPTGIQAIKDGTEIAAIQQDPYQEGVQAVGAAVKLIKGQKVTRNVVAPANVITKANVDSVTPY